MPSEDDYVAMMPGGDWVAVFTSDDVKPQPIVAWVMRRDGTIEAVGADLEDPQDKEFFGHYEQRDK